MKKLDILFIHPNASVSIYQGLSKDHSAIETPIWAGMLAQHCRLKGFGARILDCEAERLDNKQSAEIIKGENPRIACFVVYGQQPSASSQNMEGAVALADELRKIDHDIKILFVGGHIAALPRDVLTKHTAVDFICQNEGVYCIADLLKCDDLDDKMILERVRGLGWRNEGQIVLNPINGIVPQERLEQDLPGIAWDLLPSFDKYRTAGWHSWPNKSIKSPFASVYTSLGCPWKCTFCWAEGTKVIVSNGVNKKIEDITEKDKLVAFDTEKNEVVETSIVKIASRECDEIHEITLSDGKLLRLTGEHPLYVEGKWVDAKDIKIGYKVLAIDPNDKISLSKKLYNPMKNQETKDKVSKAIKEQYANGRKSRFFEEGFASAHRPDKETQLILSAASSERMKKDNPMHNEGVRNRVSATAKERYLSGETIPFMCTDQGREIISKIAKERALTNNPMKKYIGDKHWFWVGDKRKGYPTSFNKELKEIIKERDNHICQICNEDKGMQLHIHHIDYNKSNCDECNLITLCKSCHMKTNHKRDHYQSLLKETMAVKGNCPHYVEVVKIEINKKKTTVYNFECSPYNNYFANYVLGHNCMINIINRTDNGDNVASDKSNVFRYWQPDFMIKELDYLAEQGITNVKIADEMFVLKEAHFMELCKKIIERKYNFNFWAYARVDCTKPHHLETLKKAGVNFLGLGIESPNQTVRKDVIKGTYKEVKIIDIIKLIKDHDIGVGANYIFGLPMDTHESMQETLNFAMEANSENCNLYCAMAYPGSPLHLSAKEKGWQLPDCYAGYSQHSYQTQNLPSNFLSAAEILKFRDEAWFKYFSSENYLSMLAGKYGKPARENVESTLPIKLKRKLLGD